MAKSQNQQVLDYIAEHGSIDCARAVADLNVYRLSARIKNLKDAGIPIVSVIRERVLEDGSRKHWAEYFMGNQS